MNRRKPLRKRAVNLKNKLWKIFSEYIRRREADENGMVSCISCGAVRHWKEIHAGHYIPRSAGLAVYFSEKNVHPQDAACNTFRHGNLSQYALALRKKYGEGILEELDALRRETRKISQVEYAELIEKYKSKLKELEAA